MLSASVALLCSVNCGLLKLKLQQISVSEQLEYMDFATQASSLAGKYSDPEANTLRPGSYKEEKLHDTSIHLDGDLDTVPVSNFMNTQCTLCPFFRQSFFMYLSDDAGRLFRDLYRYPSTEVQS